MSSLSHTPRNAIVEPGWNRRALGPFKRLEETEDLEVAHRRELNREFYMRICELLPPSVMEVLPPMLPISKRASKSKDNWEPFGYICLMPEGVLFTIVDETHKLLVTGMPERYLVEMEALSATHEFSIWLLEPAQARTLLGDKHKVNVSDQACYSLAAVARMAKARGKPGDSDGIDHIPPAQIRKNQPEPVADDLVPSVRDEDEDEEEEQTPAPELPEPAPEAGNKKRSRATTDDDDRIAKKQATTRALTNNAAATRRADAHLAELEKSIADKNALMDQLKADNDRLMARNSELFSTQITLSEKLDAQTAQLSGLQELRSNFDSLQTSTWALHQQFDRTCEAHRKAIEEKNTEKSGEIATLVERVQQLEKQLLDSSIVASDGRELEQAKLELAEQAAALQQARQEIAERTALDLETKRAITSLNQHAEQLAARNLELDDDNTKLRGELLKLRDDIAALAAREEELRVDNVDLSGQKHELETKIEAAASLVNQYQIVNAGHLERIALLEKQIQERGLIEQEFFAKLGYRLAGSDPAQAFDVFQTLSDNIVGYMEQHSAAVPLDTAKEPVASATQLNAHRPIHPFVYDASPEAGELPLASKVMNGTGSSTHMIDGHDTVHHTVVQAEGSVAFYHGGSDDDEYEAHKEVSHKRL